MLKCQRTQKAKASGPGRPRSSTADKAILRAAFRLFVERGIDGVAIEKIAESAGVARTTIYRRWSSKEALIAEAIAADRGAAEERALAKQISPPVMVEEVIKALVETLSVPNYQKMVARLVGSVPDYPQLMSTYWRTYLVPRRDAAVKILEKARIEGLISNEASPEILLDLIGGSVMHYVLVQQGDCSQGMLHAYLIKIFRQLGLIGAPVRQRGTQ